MPNNYVLLERIELNANATTVTFNNIPQTGYTDLKLVMSVRTTYAGAQSDYLVVKFNGTTTTYTGKLLIGTGTSVASISPTGWRWFSEVNSNGQTANTFGNAEVYIPNYNVSGIQKSYSSDSVSESNASVTEMEMFGGLWSGTDAITSIEMASGNSGNFMTGSTFSLYGIAKLGTTPAIAPKADGGNVIATDGTYWYHAFLANGTFTPQVALSADVLVVAGGGGGAGYGGGGGAGGLQGFTSQSLSATGYACTVGAGGVKTPYNTPNIGLGNNSQFGALTASVGGGGGGSATNYRTGGNGGSGGGGGGHDPGNGNANGGTATAGQGNAGGTGTSQTSAQSAGGGGGAGAAGAATTGIGGVGLSTYSSWGAATGTGQNVSSTYYFAGGGSGHGNTPGPNAGGYGGGGSGGYGGSGSAGTTNTGGGGGAWQGDAGAGGSGIIIIRYLVA